ncbi:hypothetical protein C8J57DRAFT_1481725 [Mycena rebaudengoi]|nr:hypothetical protein C8J57DRAFT_1481725 [Mycena rebaudengoi]
MTCGRPFDRVPPSMVGAASGRSHRRAAAYGGAGSGGSNDFPLTNFLIIVAAIFAALWYLNLLRAQRRPAHRVTQQAPRTLRPQQAPKPSGEPLHTTTRKSALTHNQPLFSLLSDRPKGTAEKPDAEDTTAPANDASHAATRQSSITQTQVLVSSTVPTAQIQYPAGVSGEDKESGPNMESVSSSSPAPRQAAAAAELRMARLQLKRKDIGKRETMLTNKRIGELEELLQAA